MKIAFIPGRWTPPHRGHILLFQWLLKKVAQKLIIGIGSCYESGTDRHPLLAFMREKMIHYSLANEGIDMERVSFVHLQDKHDWPKWWEHVTGIPDFYLVTHFVTGNQEQILNEINDRSMHFDFQILIPARDMSPEYQFFYHSKDLCEAIVTGDYDFFQKVAASGTIALMGHVGGFAGIRTAMENAGPQFIPGRQTVDLFVTCGKGNDKYLLCGYRNKKKKDFPGWLASPGGAIKTYENPMDAAVRELKEETGLKVGIACRYLEPSHVIVDGVISEMRFIGLFSTTNPNFGHSEGGSSQVFHIDLDITPDRFNGLLKSESDLEKVAFRPVKEVIEERLAFQRSEMLKTALKEGGETWVE